MSVMLSCVLEAQNKHHLRQSTCAISAYQPKEESTAELGIPSAHWSAPLSRLWILFYRSREEDTPAIHAAHERLGPIIRIAPDELSINSVDGGIRTIYAGGYEKGDWYSNMFTNYGVMPMFAMPNHGPHSKRKRMISNIYAKTTLQNSQPLNVISKTLLDDRLIPRLGDMAKDGKSVEFYWIFAAVAMDFVSAYVFGLGQSTNYVQAPIEGDKFFQDYKARQRYQFWPQDMPRLTSFLGKVGLQSLIIPAWVNRANRDIEALILRMCDKAEKVVQNCECQNEKLEEGSWPNVYAQLRNALLKEASTKADLEALSSVEGMVQKQRLTVASEMLDHTLAGFDTSSITLTFLAWELSRPENNIWQARLRDEIANLDDKHDAKAIDTLPILQAILMESLRLHAAIPGNQPRITPANATLGASPDTIFSQLPPGVRVQSQAWSLHRHPSVFPKPEHWDPSRWLPESYPSQDAFEAAQKEMLRWFWAFGSGGRMCVGSNLAMYDMKAIIVAIWSSFGTKVAERGGDGMVHRGGYVAEPVGKDGKFLELALEAL
ncbi:hypothetical protein LTR78_004073 [Recurvomyces mirabilis]|uniref:Cytochrome P450 n=1 Tax=Recurvomyces mirabilis TaxID=574656 RepID=A0AAE1C2P0_9PEZI|nr:hypothetical protein LTR78_004073 [Recurvomyces mirabilis]KAK5153755.1 hypothetical protein LTS14_007449 [Recurvomyces mirabilis]